MLICCIAGIFEKYPAFPSNCSPKEKSSAKTNLRVLHYRSEEYL